MKQGRFMRSIALVAGITSVLAFAGAPVAHAADQRSVTIGVIAPVDGGLTSFGRGIRNSVTLAVQQAVQKATVKGWDIQVRTLDDSSDPTKGQSAARALASDPSVVAVIGPYNSGVALLAAPALAKQGVALISPSNTLTSLTVGADPTHPKRQWKTYFRMVGQDLQQAKFLAAQAKKLGYTTAAVVSETKAVSKGLADEFTDAFKAEGGKVTVRQTVPDGASAADFAGFLTTAAPTKPQLLFFGGEYNVGGTLRAAATNAGLSAPLMGGDGMFDPAFITGAGASATGSYASGVGIPLATLPNSQAFQAAYQAAGFADAPSDYGPQAYDAANAVLAAVAKELKGKSSLPSGIRAAVVRAIQGTLRKGVTGTVAFDKYGDTTNPVFSLYHVSGSPPAWQPAG